MNTKSTRWVKKFSYLTDPERQMDQKQVKWELMADFGDAIYGRKQTEESVFLSNSKLQICRLLI